MDSGQPKKGKVKQEKDEEQEKSEARTSTMSHFRKQTGDALIKNLKQALPDLMPDMDGAPADEKGIMHEMFFPQAFSHVGTHTYSGALPHGVAEARMLTEGSCVFLGVHMDTAKGETLQALIDK